MKAVLPVVFLLAFVAICVVALLSRKPFDVTVPVGYTGTGAIEMIFPHKRYHVDSDFHATFPSGSGTVTLESHGHTVTYSYSLTTGAEEYWFVNEKPLSISGGGLSQLK